MGEGAHAQVHPRVGLLGDIGLLSGDNENANKGRRAGDCGKGNVRTTTTLSIHGNQETQKVVDLGEMPCSAAILFLVVAMDMPASRCPNKIFSAQ